MSGDSSALLVGAIKKNKREEVRVFLDEYMGRKVCNARIFAVYPNGDAIPTRKGLTLTTETLRDYRDLIDQAITQAEAQGLATRRAA
ncbi:MAG: PC4/YdbC family ssDNA-binding protein [Rhodospirillaceae bacterium]